MRRSLKLDRRKEKGIQIFNSNSVVVLQFLLLVVSAAKKLLIVTPNLENEDFHYLISRFHRRFGKAKIINTVFIYAWKVTDLLLLWFCFITLDYWLNKKKILRHFCI